MEKPHAYADQYRHERGIARIGDNNFRVIVIVIL
jgi:hypothetical protein